MKSQYILLLEPDLADKAEHEGGLSELVGSLLQAHFNGGLDNVMETLPLRRHLTGRGMLAGQPGSVDEFIARKAEEKAMER